MKNLLAFTAFLAAGFFLGSRRARKTGPIEQFCIEVKADTKEAYAALKELQAQIVKTEASAIQFNQRSANLVAIIRQQEYRSSVTNTEQMLCRGDIDALQARQDAGEVLTDAEHELLCKYQIPA